MKKNNILQYLQIDKYSKEIPNIEYFFIVSILITTILITINYLTK
jgi:hypothetical protein